MDLVVKRVYEQADPADGYRVLIDRLWPRGVAKAKAALDEWAKDLAPSTELRQWFGHDPALWDGFRNRYRAELDGVEVHWQPLLDRAASGRVTILFGASDHEHNNAVALREYLLDVAG